MADNKDLVARLLAPLSAEHARLLRVIWEGFLHSTNNVWPVWDFVSGTLADERLDALALIQTLPSQPWGQSRYSPVWTYTGYLLAPGPNEQVGLTILGVARCGPDAGTHVRVFLEALRFFATSLRQEPVRPDRALAATVSHANLTSHYMQLGPGDAGAARWRTVWVSQALAHEPSMGWTRTSGEPHEEWSTIMDRDILKFEAVKTIEDYLHVLTSLLPLPPQYRMPASIVAAPKALATTEELSALHPVIVERCAALFHDEHFEGAIVDAFKAVEVRLRDLSGAPDDLVGVNLVTFALKPKDGKLQLSTVRSEQEAIHSLFRGAIGWFKNPRSHRFLDRDNATSTLEALGFASHLLRLLDGVATTTGGGAEADGPEKPSD